MGRSIAAIAVAAMLAAGAAQAESLPRVDPEKAGLMPDQLNAITDRFRADTEAGKIPGAVLMIVRGGEIAYLEAFGQRDARDGTPMTDDSIFRIYSMTKPITSLVAMQLIEEGRLALSDPIEKYIPAFAEARVGTETPGTDGGMATVEEAAARKGPTVHDLLRHTSGIIYGVFGSGAIRDMYKEMGITDGEMSAFDQAQALGGLPLAFEPGTGWEYGRSTDVLGAVIEVVEEKPLGEVMQERVFGPLGMDDTGFWVDDEAKLPRVAQPLDDDAGGRDALLDPTVEPVYVSGGGGLFSTAHDYARFLTALMNGGELDGVRLLGPKMVDYMTADHMGDIPKAVPDGVSTIGYLPGPGYSFGLGFGVRTDLGQAAAPGSVGEYYWGGYAGTYFWNDPVEDMSVIYMMQSVTQRVPYRAVLRNMIYGAVVPLVEVVEMGSEPQTN